MLARTRDRLARLETEILPRPRAFVFFSFDAGEADAPSRDDRLAAFRAEYGVAPSDLIHEVSFRFS
jgi:hypothetical protein